MHLREDLSGNRHGLEREVCVKRVGSLIRLQLDAGFYLQFILDAFGLLGDADFEHAVAVWVLQLYLVVLLDHALYDMLQLSVGQTEFYQSTVLVPRVRQE